MFSAPKAQDDRPIEVVEEKEKAERVPLEEDVDRLRASAFTGQEWATKYFGLPEAEGNEYRVSKKGQHYYLETLHKFSGKSAHGYSGLMVHERDLYNLVKVLVQAVREKQASEAGRERDGSVV